jgi:hypothetical protein
MFYIIAALKSTPQFPEHATQFKSLKEAGKVLEGLEMLKLGFLDCKIVDQEKYNLICMEFPCVGENTRSHDTRQKI